MIIAQLGLILTVFTTIFSSQPKPVDVAKDLESWVVIETVFQELNQADQSLLSELNFDLEQTEDYVFTSFTATNIDPAHTQFILRSGTANHTWIYFKNEQNSTYSLKRAGRLVPFPENELSRFGKWDGKALVELEPGRDTQFYVITDQDSGNSNIGRFEMMAYEVWENRFYKDSYQANIKSGIFFGILIALSVINFVFYLVYKDPNYPIYSIYILCLILYEAFVYGVFNMSTNITQFPKAELFADNLLLNLSIIFYLFFLKSFIDLNKYPQWKRIIPRMIILMVINIIVPSIIFLAFENIELGYMVRNITILLVIPFAFIFLVKLLQSDLQTDKIFFYGSLALITFGTISILDFLFFESSNSDLILRIGIVIEGIIFAIGLGIKVKITYKQNLLAQSKLIEQLEKNEKLQISLNKDLEALVDVKTEELKLKNQDLEQARNNLEQVVEERTSQLVKSNDELVSQNQQLEQYAFITAHNLKAPVARLKGLTYLFNKGAEDNPDDNNEIVERIAAAATDLDSTLQDLNKVLKIRSKVKIAERFSLQESIDRVIASLHDEIVSKGVKIRTSLEVDEIYSNKAYFDSIFYNLISNSIKYRNSEHVTQIEISNHANEGTLKFVISDNGIGVDMDKYGDKIFGLYQRFHSHVEGKGMGLFIVKSQVESLMGKIKLQSSIGNGSVFYIDFPLEKVVGSQD